jgi:tRNA threonylcarbamoyladenosine biosynthesis protein TsaE
MNTYIAQNINDLSKISKEFIADNNSNKIFAFYGKMGAGKTTFIKELCKSLGSDDIVTSPTFAIVNEYQTPKNGKIFHFDFYRIESEEEAFDIGFEDYIYQDNYCFIEWPERIENLLPKNFTKVIITEEINGNRTIHLL